MKKNRQKGFTMIEIAVVLVIIGLLMGGILKGQELINSARVRNLSNLNTGVQGAYYGFLDRYRKVPGDFAAAAATQAIGAEITLPQTGSSTANNGRIDNTLEEAAAAWEQLAKSNFLVAGFTPAIAKPSSEAEYAKNAPVNAYSGALILTRNKGYSNANKVERLNLHLGRNVPVNIVRELDIKLDDGRPNTGMLRLSSADGTNTAFDTLNFKASNNCTTDKDADGNNNQDGTGLATDIYDIYRDAQDCVPVFLY